MNKKILKTICLCLSCVFLFGLTGCGNKENSSQNPHKDMSVILPTEVSIEEIVSSVKEVCGDSYLPDKQLTEKEFNKMLDIDSDMYQEFYAEISSDETKIDKFLIVKTENPLEMQQKFEDLKMKTMQIEDVEEVDERRQSRLANSMTGISGNFAFYFVLGEEYVVDENLEMNEQISQEIQHYIDANQKVLTTILDTINNWQPPTLEEYTQNKK